MNNDPRDFMLACKRGGEGRRGRGVKLPRQSRGGEDLGVLDFACRGQGRLGRDVHEDGLALLLLHHDEGEARQERDDEEDHGESMRSGRMYVRSLRRG